MSPRRAKVLAGRVGDDPAAALRDHLVDAAALLMTRMPLATITTREIARTAGVSDGVLYNYFGDKHDLLVEALLRQFRRLFGSAVGRIPVPGTGTIEANLASIATMLLELELEVLPMVAGLLADPILFHRTMAAFHTDPGGPQWFRAPLVSYFDGERRLGRIRPDADPDSLLLLLMGSTSILALSGQLGPGGAPDAPKAPDRVRAIVDEILRGLRTEA